MKFDISIQIALCFLLLTINQGIAQTQTLTSADQKQQAIRLYNQSIKPLQEGDYIQAAALLKTAIELDDSQPLIQNNYGLVLLKIGKPDEALEHLLKAISFNPTLAIAWMNLGNAYETKHQYKVAVESFQKYLQLDPKSPDAIKVRAHIDLIQNEFTSTGDIAPLLNEQDYLMEATKKVKLRWAADRMPVKVYVGSGERVSGFKPEYADLLKQASDDWLLASAGKISFLYIDNKNKADIVIRWSDDISSVVSPAEGGDCRYNGNGKGLNQISITLLTVNPSSSMKLTPNMVGWIAHHEIGHALGLLGHSPNSDDIMYFSAPQQDRPAVLSNRDKQTIFKLYSGDLGPTMLSLNDEGIEAYKRGDSELAINKYREALDLDPSAAIPRRNLIRAEYSRGVQLIQQGNFIEGELHFKNALSLEDSNPDENLSLLVKNYIRLLHMMHRDHEAKILAAKYKF